VRIATAVAAAAGFVQGLHDVAFPIRAAVRRFRQYQGAAAARRWNRKPLRRRLPGRDVLCESSFSRLLKKSLDGKV